MLQNILAIQTKLRHLHPEMYSNAAGETYSNAVGDEDTGEPDTTEPTADDESGVPTEDLPRFRILVRTKKTALKVQYGKSHWVKHNQNCSETGWTDAQKAAAIAIAGGFGITSHTKHCKGWRSYWKTFKQSGGLATLKQQAKGTVPLEGAAPAGYTKCAEEWETYTLPQKSDVAFGANGKFKHKYGRTGNITFNIATFGDPLPNVVKAGYCKPVVTTTGNGDTTDTGADLDTVSGANWGKIALIGGIAVVVILGAYFGYKNFIK